MKTIFSNFIYFCPAGLDRFVRHNQLNNPSAYSHADSDIDRHDYSDPITDPHTNTAAGSGNRERYLHLAGRF